MSKPIQISDEVYDRLKPYTNGLPNRSKKKAGFSTAIEWLLNFKDGVL
jgi:predicted CopG family antitoxin